MLKIDLIRIVALQLAHSWISTYSDDKNAKWLKILHISMKNALQKKKLKLIDNINTNIIQNNEKS